MADFENILVGDAGRVRTITLNRPHVHNALSLATVGELARAVDDAGRDGVPAIVVTGSGDRTFCSGGDLKEFDALQTREAAVGMSLQVQRLSRAIRRSPAVVIAAMNGDVYGGGFEFALASDIRVANQTARMGFVQVKLAITPAWRGVSRALEILPRSRALLLFATGERFSAEQALAWGLVDRLAPPGEVMAAALEIAQQIAAHSALAVGTIKRMIDSPRGTDSDEELQREAELFATAWLSEEHWTALAASRAARAARG